MIFQSINVAKPQVDALFQKYPGLQMVSETQNQIVIAGWIKIARVFNDFPVVKNVQLEITIPIEKDCFPSVKDIGGHINAGYPHRYQSGILCLATDIDLRLHFLDGFNLVKWMEDFVEPYYYSYDYYQRFGYYPFGDRDHGCLGAIQSYGDWFSTSQIDITVSILRNIEANNHYRGHHPCFCGSGKKMRDCHGNQIIYFYQHSKLRNQLISDLNYIRKEIKQFDNARNRSSSK